MQLVAFHATAIKIADVMRVHRRRSKGKKIFEYLVDEFSTWITKDRLRISLSLMLFAELKGN